MDERVIIVGIDFGTTYSGVAFAEAQRAGVPSAITTWPVSRTNLEGESCEKVPTKLHYGENGTHWGFTIPIGADKVVEWFKLDLDPSLERLEKSNANSDCRGIRTADELTSDFLGFLLEHLMYTLREKLGEAVIASVPLEFVLTVPAVWSDLAKDKTRLSFLNAGPIGSKGNVVHLVAEPEAAALYSLSQLNTHGLKVGDGVVVVDAGGGTVDLITYKISKLDPTLEVQEAAEGSGGLCGSTFLNQRFERFLKSKLDGQEGFDQEVLAEAMETFETKTKRQFISAAGPNDKFSIPLRGVASNPSIGIVRNRLNITTQELGTIFEPVIREVIQLVKDQIAASTKGTKVKAVLLVGGFGASAYLKEKLREALSSDIKILQPPYAWQAVVGGAVLKGLANKLPGTTAVQVASRKARNSYGVSMYSYYLPEVHKHLEHAIRWSPKDGWYRVENMLWFTKRGQELRENSPVSISYNDTKPVHSGRPQSCSMRILYDKSQRTLDDKAMQRDEDIVYLASIQADVSSIPEEEFNRFQGADDVWYYDLNFKIEAIFLSASIAFSLSHKGQKYSTVTCEYK